MGNIGYWDSFWHNMGPFESQAINEAQDLAADAQAMAWGAQQRIDRMAREILALRTALNVVVQTLKDTKAIDEHLLDVRMQAAMEEAFPPPPEAAAATPASPIMTVCKKCQQKVLASTTNMTAQGPVCDRCPPATPPYR